MCLDADKHDDAEKQEQEEPKPKRIGGQGDVKLPAPN